MDPGWVLTAAVVAVIVTSGIVIGRRSYFVNDTIIGMVVPTVLSYGFAFKKIVLQRSITSLISA